MSCYYIASEDYLLSQLKNNGITINLNISDYEHVRDSCARIADALEESGLLCRSCSEAVNDMYAEQSKPFICCHMSGVKYYFLSWNAVAQAVSEYRRWDKVYPFIIMIADQFTVERGSAGRGKRIVKRDFGRSGYQPDELDVLGKLTWDGDKAYIQPLILY